jgi:hypothetical protein
LVIQRGICLFSHSTLIEHGASCLTYFIVTKNVVVGVDCLKVLRIGLDRRIGYVIVTGT